jgi:CPA1 family monovalent cation:H+ antiporter
MRYFGGVDPDDMIGTGLLLPVVSLSVAIIMFEGGMTLQLLDVRKSGGVVLRLVTVGVVVSWLLTWWLASSLLQMNSRLAALTGAILVVTGPTVIAPLLRFVRPSRKIASIIKWEGIVIDPIGAVLAVLVFEALFGVGPGEHWNVVAVSLTKTLLVGVGISVVTGLLLIQMLKRYWIADFLHNPVLLAVALGVFTVSNKIQTESGLVTVTLLGVILANQKSVSIRHVIEFKENLRVLLISCLFIVLAARIDLGQVMALGWRGIAFLAAMILIVRPLSVLASAGFSDLNWREITFLSFLAPRGIVAASVSSVFALEVAHVLHQAEAGVTEGVTAIESMAEAGIPIDPDMLVNATFLVIVGTVTFYGLLAAPLARWLQLASPNPQGILFVGSVPWIRQLASIIQSEGFPVMLVDTNFSNISEARMSGLPARCADILSEFVTKQLDLAGIGRLLAMTPNADLNRLAAMEFSHDFGSAEVYQLAHSNGGKVPRSESAGHGVGRVLFAPDVGFSEIAERWEKGAEFKRTNITPEFTFDDFVTTHGESAMVLFAITETKQLLVATIDTPLTPKPGQAVIAMVGP